MLNAQHVLFFFSEIFRRVIGADLAHVGWVGVAGVVVRIGAIQAAEGQCAKSGAALGRQEFAAGQRANKGGVGIDEAVVAATGQAAQHTGRIGLAQLLLVAVAIILFAEIIGHRVDSGVFRRFPADATADGIKIAAIDAGVVEHVGGVAIALQISAGDTDRQIVGDGQVEHALQTQRVVIAVFDFACGMDGVHPRLGVDEVYDAAGGVAAEQRALRAAQHFNALKIEEFGFEQAGGEQRHAFGVDGGGGIAGHAHAQIADAANGEAGTGEVALGEGDVGQGQLDIERVVDLLALQSAGIEGGHRDRHVLQALRRALRGHDDFGDAGVFIGLRGLRECRQGGQTDERCAGHQTGTNTKCNLHMTSSPKIQKGRILILALMAGSCSVT